MNRMKHALGAIEMRRLNLFVQLFILSTVFNQSLATVVAMSDQRLQEMCYKGSDWLSSDICWNKTYEEQKAEEQTNIRKYNSRFIRLCAYGIIPQYQCSQTSSTGEIGQTRPNDLTLPPIFMDRPGIQRGEPRQVIYDYGIAPFGNPIQFPIERSIGTQRVIGY